MSKSMRLLVTGANGQLGWELCRMGPPCGHDVIPLDLPGFDITDPSRIDEAFVQDEIFLAINAAAYTAVDKAESEPEIAFAVNSEGPAYMARVCARHNIPLIHISTDYVFDGNKGIPYIETDPTCPVGIYAESKAAGEKAVREALQSHIILRTSWLYGAHGNNFVKTILRLAKEREELRVVDDQYGSPTYAGDLAGAIFCIADHIRAQRPVPWGTYHYCGRGVTTWHEFAQKICELGKVHAPMRVKEIKAISTDEYPTPAKRPPFSSLDCAKIEKCFGVARRPWQDSLAEMLATMFADAA
jgi:dTDP-4-dehydrorhamnose reductase